MIRARKIELTNIKNVHHGSIEFRDEESGSSIAGIYGQNGSGKTAVVDAFSCLKLLMCGQPLPTSAKELIGVSSPIAEIAIEFEVTRETAKELGIEEDAQAAIAAGKPFFAEYRFSCRIRNSIFEISSESIAVRASGMPKRTLIAYNLGETGKDYTFAPEIRWRALRNLAGSEASMELSLSQRSAELASSSKIFSKAFKEFVEATKSGYSNHSADGTVSHAGTEAYARTLLPLSGIISILASFASLKLEVFDTTRGASLAFDFLPFSAPDGLKPFMKETGDQPNEEGRYFRDILLRSDRSSVLPVSVCPELQATIGMENKVLAAIVPGLTLELKELNNETLDNGKPGKRVELLSCRGSIRVPFRCESEGIKKIVSILGRLIDVYADANACLVIDELDSGIFEFLLGELLQVIADHGKGQLIFTAHNLRPLECLPSGCLVFTTTNPDNRYIRFRGSAATNNLRSQYIRAINLGGQKEQVYEPTDELDIDAAFYHSCHPEVADFDTLVASLGGTK
ncbi:MAG: AAA family ATPase [Atopobiaceae bacterium]